MAKKPESDPLPTPKISVPQEIGVGLSMLLSRVLGLIRDIITARYFPPEIRDAFVIAFRFPNFFRRILTEGAVSAGLVPQLQKNRIASDQALARFTFAVLMSAALVLTIFGILFIGPILKLCLSSEAFLEIPGKMELTIALSRIMFLFLALVSLFSYLMATQHADGHFLRAALAPALFNAALIGVACLPARDPRQMAFQLAWAVVLGGILQIAVLLPNAWRSGWLPRPSQTKFILNQIWQGQGFSAFKNLLPILLGLHLLPITGLINLVFASRLPQGSLSYFYLADRLLELPISLIGGSIAIVSLPVLAELWRKPDHLPFVRSTERSVLVGWFWLLPCATGLFFLAGPIVEVLFVGKSFSASEAIPTALIVQVYALALLPVVTSRQLAQAFYAGEMVWFPSVTTLVAALAHTILSFSFLRFGVGALAFATVASQLVQLALLSLRFEKQINHRSRTWLRWKAWRVYAQWLLPVLAAGACAQSYIWYARMISIFFPRWLALGATLTTVMAGYLALRYLLSPNTFIRAAGLGKSENHS